MPNWITNKIAAPKHVLQSMVNGHGHIDFDLMAPFPGPRGKEWKGIMCDAEEAAEIVCGIPTNDHPLIASMQAANRSRFDIKNLKPESFEQFIGMLENYRACGYLHSMDWARKKWGTKWNACEQSIDLEAGTASFDTAWACPELVLVELSKKFPDDEITVIFADEDIGSNCGIFKLKGGQMIEHDVAKAWHDMDDEARNKWRMFAYKVKGYSDEEIAEREAKRMAD